MRKVVRVIMAGSILVLMLLGYSSLYAWTISTVDSTGIVGTYTSIALDSSGYPHISYYDDFTNYDLKYAKWNGSAWSIETVDATGNVGFYTSIALDSSGYPHISYYTSTNENLKYAKWTGSAWSMETVDSTGAVGYYTSIALDSSGYPHVSYYDAANEDLKYVKWNGSAWSTETVDSNGSVGSYTSIALNGDDVPNIAYYDNNNADLKYVKANARPTLTYTAETNYSTSGVYPLSGDVSTSFVYRVKYTDADNDAPKSGYPKVHIKKGGTAITGSPFTMTEVESSDTTYTDGKLYTYSKSGLTAGTDYTYYFEALDANDGTATGAGTTATDNPDVSNPDVSNNVPTLDYTGESGYTASGVKPQSGDTALSFVYRIKYTDADNDAPKSGYPKLHIKKGGTAITGSPFTMDAVERSDTTYTDGKLYTYSKSGLTAGTDYTYYFEALDANDAAATGAVTSALNGPEVTVVTTTAEIKVQGGENGAIKPRHGEQAQIMITAEGSGQVAVKVYTMRGELVWETSVEVQPGIRETVLWSCRNAVQEVVASGIYLVHIQGAGLDEKKKIAVVK